MSCFVPGCNTGYRHLKMWNKRIGKKNPSLFKAPNDHEMLKTWEELIRRADKSLTSKDMICELHFKEEFLDRFYTTTLSDGTLFSLRRGRAKLKPGAVPTVYDNQNPQLRGLNKPAQRKRNLVSRKMKKKTDEPINSDVDLTTKPEPVEDLPKGKPSSGFENFNLSLISLPTKCWFAFRLENKIGFICARPDDLSISKRIVLHPDWSFEVFFGGIQVFLQDLPEKLDKITNMASILLEIDRTVF